jgi:hypothetical protein
MKQFFLSALLFSALVLSCTPPRLPPSVTLTQIDVYLAVGRGATGAFTIEVRDATGTTPAIWSTAVDAHDLTPGLAWNSFSIPHLTFYSGRTYRIYLTRSGPHDNATGNTIAWECPASADIDEYPYGRSSLRFENADFTFRVYVDGVINQSMETAGYGYSISHYDDWWQEFVPAK